MDNHLSQIWRLKGWDKLRDLFLRTGNILTMAVTEKKRNEWCLGKQGWFQGKSHWVGESEQDPVHQWREWYLEQWSFIHESRRDAKYMVTGRLITRYWECMVFLFHYQQIGIGACLESVESWAEPRWRGGGNEGEGHRRVIIMMDLEMTLIGKGYRQKNW